MTMKDDDWRDLTDAEIDANNKKALKWLCDAMAEDIPEKRMMVSESLLKRVRDICKEVEECLDEN